MRIPPGILLLALCSCVRVNLSSGGDRLVAYLIDPLPAAPSATSWDMGVVVHDFSASPPYDTRGMVMITQTGTVITASRNLWAASPADACADLLWRDMVTSGAVASALRSHHRHRSAMTVEAHMSEFGARETSAGWQAALEITVTLTPPAESGPVLQHNYHLARPLAEEGFPALSVAMSVLAREWSDSTLAAVSRMAGELASLGGSSSRR